MIGFIIRQAGEIEVNGPDGVERINGLLLEGDVSHIRLAAVWFGERVSIAPIVSPSPSQVAPQTQAGEPKMAFEDTFSAETLVMKRFFPASPQPANPAHVTDAMVNAASAKYREIGARCNWQHSWPSEEAFREILTAAIGAGGQAVANDAETLKASAASVLCEAGALCGWPAPNCNAREGAEALFKAGLLSQPHPADERVVEAVDGVSLIAAERRRQIEKEGWSLERDDAYRDGELARAGGIYAVIAGADATDFRNAKDGYSLTDYLSDLVKHYWPWDKSWLKVTTRQRALEKAGACIAAEIDRLLRLSAKEGRKHG